MQPDKEILEAVAEHIQREQEIIKSTNEALDCKVRLRVEEIARQVFDEQGLQISQGDFEAFVEQQIKNLLSSGRKSHKSMITINEVDL